MADSQDNYVTLFDDQGNETLHEVLFTFHSDQNNNDYILLTPISSDDDEASDVFAYRFHPDKNGEATNSDLEEIEDDEEWAMVEEVLDAYLSDDE